MQLYKIRPACKLIAPDPQEIVHLAKEIKNNKSATEPMATIKLHSIMKQTLNIKNRTSAQQLLKNNCLQL